MVSDNVRHAHFSMCETACVGSKAHESLLALAFDDPKLPHFRTERPELATRDGFYDRIVLKASKLST